LQLLLEKEGDGDNADGKNTLGHGLSCNDRGGTGSGTTTHTGGDEHHGGTFQGSADVAPLGLGCGPACLGIGTGAQAGVLTDSKYGKASIVGVLPERVARSIQTGSVAIVAGFQGISKDDDVTTLGRGGSDTTAVALAAALHADVCEIYTDVDGLYTAPPDHPGSKLIERVESADDLMSVLVMMLVTIVMNVFVFVHTTSSFL